MTQSRVLAVLFEDAPKSSRVIMRETGLSRGSVAMALNRLWRGGRVLRTAEAIYESERVFKGRAGVSSHTRPYHLYVVAPAGMREVALGGLRYVAYGEEYVDVRGGRGLSKAKRILRFLEENIDRAWFSGDVADALGEHGVNLRDVMANVRRYERKGLVYVRGYKSDERETPFRRGFLLTWIYGGLPRDEAIRDAIRRTEAALEGEASASPTLMRIHRIRDTVLEHSQLRQLVSPVFIENKLGCSAQETKYALEKALRMYPDIKVVKLFDSYRYLYHESLGDVELSAAVEMKKNYIRKVKGAANRVGHNWEAVAEWFIDRTTTGARFWTQNHRNGVMDPRRITLHLIKGVGGRRLAAEMDRVWEVTPGVFAPTITYVLSCKWGLVTKAHVDDFLEVLKWSKEFGVDTPDGREIRQGVVGVFAAGAFKPSENVQLKDGAKISLAQYAARRNLQLITAANFNKMLREKGCPKEATVQMICRAARDEAQVRGALDMFWGKPGEATEALGRLRRDNQDLYRFEKMLEEENE